MSWSGEVHIACRTRRSAAGLVVTAQRTKKLLSLSSEMSTCEGVPAFAAVASRVARSGSAASACSACGGASGRAATIRRTIREGSPASTVSNASVALG
jgi:hypothetical protein